MSLDHNQVIKWNGLKSALDKLSAKLARKTGYYSTLTAGSAENLIVQNDLESQFTERTTADGASIENGDAVITTVRGNTIVHNQLVKNGNFVDSSNWIAYHDASFSVYNNICTVTSTSSGDNYLDQRPTLIEGHTYLFSGDAKSDDNNDIVIYIFKGTAARPEQIIAADTEWHSYNRIFTCNGTSTQIIRLYVLNHVGVHQFKNIQLFDLTQMFGTTSNAAIALKVSNFDTDANKVTAIENFKKLWPYNYYEYNTGTLKSFTARGLLCKPPMNVTWNQLIRNGNFIGTNNWTLTGDGDIDASNNILSVTYNTNPTVSYSVYVSHWLYLTPNHKYFFTIETNTDHSGHLHIDTNRTFSSFNIETTANTWTSYSIILSNPTTAGTTFSIYPDAVTDGYVTGDSYRIRNVMIMDLTNMFGEGNEPNTVEQFESWLSENNIDINTYQAYNAGIVKQMVMPLWVRPNININWNQLSINDHETGTYNGITFTLNSDKTYTAVGTSTRRANYYVNVYKIPIIYKHKYFLTGSPSGGESSTYHCNVSWYGSSYLETIGYDYGDGIIVTCNNIDASAASVEMIAANTGEQTVNITFVPMFFDLTQMFGEGNEPDTTEQFITWLSENNINVRQYQVYNTGVIRQMKRPSWYADALFPSELILRGAGSVKDDLTDNIITRRTNKTNLGNRTWYRDNTTGVFYTELNSSQANLTNNNIICSKYTNTMDGTSTMPDKSIHLYWGIVQGIHIKDSSYNDVASFKNSLSDTYLVFERASIITEDVSTWNNIYTVYPNGKELILPIQMSAYSTWFDGIIDYRMDSVDILRNINKNFVSTNVNQELTAQAKNNARLNINAQETLVSGSNIKTINNTSILGSGNISITQVIWRTY